MLSRSFVVTLPRNGVVVELASFKELVIANSLKNQAKMSEMVLNNAVLLMGLTE